MALIAFEDIEDGKINCVVTKDLSRLGRNYILTGQYTELYFPSKGVRYIAIHDGVDTIREAYGNDVPEVFLSLWLTFKNVRLVAVFLRRPPCGYRDFLSGKGAADFVRPISVRRKREPPRAIG